MGFCIEIVVHVFLIFLDSMDEVSNGDSCICICTLMHEQMGERIKREEREEETQEKKSKQKII